MNHVRMKNVSVAAAKYSVRKMIESDLEQIIQWRMDPDITRYMNTDPVLSIEIQKQWYSKIKNDNKVRYWTIEVDGQPVGVINLADIDWENHTSSWGYYIGDKASRSLQLALSLEMSLYDYVFDRLNFDEIHNEVLSENAGVIKIHEICGASITNVRIGEVEKNGRKFDVTHMSIRKEKWIKMRRNKHYIKINFEDIP